MQVRVYYEDTDFSGIVYHANYLRFMERGRTNHLRLMGAEQHALFAEAQAETPGFAFVVRSMQIDFLRPARMDDVLDVVTWPVAVKGASITLAQEVRRGEDVLVKAEVRVAFISEGRAQPIPKSLRLLMKADLAWTDLPIDVARTDRYNLRRSIRQAGEVTMSRPPLPPFTRETAAQKARMAEDAWNSRDPERVALAYTEDSRWRNRSEFFQGRAAIVAFLTRKWAKEHDYRLIKDLWAFDQNRIAVRFQYEWHDDAGQWHRSYGNEQWEFDEHGLMRRREASINDIADRGKRPPLPLGGAGAAPGRCRGIGRESVLTRMLKNGVERRQLLRALGEVFRAHGYEGASLTLITEATGLGKGSLYHLFPGGKAQMAAEVLAEIDGWFELNIFAPLREASTIPPAPIADDGRGRRPVFSLR